MGWSHRSSSLLLPVRCPVCGRAGAAPCGACWAALRPAPHASPPPSGLDGCRSLLRYEGAGRELLARLKYRNARGSVAWLAEGMARLARSLAAGVGGIDVVTWAPTSVERRRGRGFDQGEVLARAVARRLGWPCRPLLLRLPGPPQTGRSGAERRRGPSFTVLGGGARWGGTTAGRGPPLAGARVLLVDDVVTSGATLAAAAAALRAAGASTVVSVTAGRTPLKVPGRSADP